MNKEIISQLLNEQGYPQHMIENTLKKLCNLQPPIASILEDWISNKKAPSCVIEGYTFDILVNDYRMKPFGAFLTLDWLVRDPDGAKRSLSRGYK